MDSSRDEVVKHSNGHDAAEVVSTIEPLKPQSPKLVDELAEAMGMARESFERARPAASLNASLGPQTTTTLPAMPPPRHFFDDEDDDAAMPIPSTWRNPPEPPRVRGLSDQLRATGLGFGTGLAIIIPVVLLMTGHLDNISVASLSHLVSGTALVNSETSPPADAGARVQQRVVATTAILPSASSPVAAEPAAVSAPPPVVQSPSATAAPAPVYAPPPRAPQMAAIEPAPVRPAVTEKAPEPASTLSSAPPPAASMPAPAATPTFGPTDIAEGTRLFRSGDISGGRNLLARVAATENPEAIMALAETYDPNMLAAWGIMNASPDVATARRLYVKALDAGVEHAATRLKGLE